MNTFSQKLEDFNGLKNNNYKLNSRHNYAKNNSLLLMNVINLTSELKSFKMLSN